MSIKHFSTVSALYRFFESHSSFSSVYAKHPLPTQSSSIVLSWVDYKQVKIIDKMKFAKAVLDEYVKAFVMHMIFLWTMAIYLAKKT